jgi:hypothetical protein
MPRARAPSLAVVAAVAALSSSSCVLPPLDLVGKRCAVEADCGAALACVDGVCVDGVSDAQLRSNQSASVRSLTRPPSHASSASASASAVGYRSRASRASARVRISSSCASIVAFAVDARGMSLLVISCITSRSLFKWWNSRRRVTSS